MKLLLFTLALSIPAVGQLADNPRVIVFNRADTAHCKAVTIDGRQFLQTEDGGTSVAIDLPTETPDGDFQVFVSIRQSGQGNVEVEPKEFVALYSDPAHSRFPYYDKSSIVAIREGRPRDASTNSGIAGAGQRVAPGDTPGTPPAPGSLNSNAWTARSRTDTGIDPNAEARRQEEVRQNKSAPAPGGSAPSSAKPSGFLSRTTLLQGTSVQGSVFFKRPKGLNKKSGTPGVLYEVDIPVNGVVYRFR
jgi:hypothetical protein